MEQQNAVRFHPHARIANFTNVPLQGPTVLSVDLRSDLDLVAELRRHADLPYVYVIRSDQSALTMTLLSQLKSIRSPCYPHAIFVVGEKASVQQESDVELIQCSSDDPVEIEARISEYARSIHAFDKGGLRNHNPAPLPSHVDVLVVGAGVTGLYAANKLRDGNRTFCVVEKSDIVGGIWSRFANTTSQVNTSEGAYRIREPRVGANADHSNTAEILTDIQALAEGVSEDLFTGAKVEKIEKQDRGGYLTSINRNGAACTVASTGVILAINDRVGTQRTITFEDEHLYQGELVNGIADEALHVDWSGKNVVVVGMGAFAVENVRTALEAGASKVTVVCRRHGTVCPKIIDYMNFTTDYDEQFEHDRKGNIRNMMLWKRLYDLSGATQPECWMGKIKHSGHTISVSDIWFIAHHLKKMETIIGSISGMFEHGVVVGNQQRIEADVVVKCVGFHRNTSEALAMLGYTEMYNNNYVDKDFMYLADAYLDDDVFNSFFGSSVVEMTKFYLDVYFAFFDNSAYDEMIQTDGIEKIAIDERSWSHYIAGAKALTQKYPRFYEAARAQIDHRTANFLEAHDLETFVAENKREWFATHRLLGGETLTEEQCLPYVFGKLIEKPMR